MQLCICESPAELNEFRGKYTKKGEGLGCFIRQGDDLLVCCCCCFFFMAVVDDKANEIYQSHPFTDKQHHSFQ